MKTCLGPEGPQKAVEALGSGPLVIYARGANPEKWPLFPQNEHPRAEGPKNQLN